MDTINDKINRITNDPGLSSGIWNVALWNESDYPELAINNQHLLGKIDKIFAEIAATDRNTVIEPLQLEVQAFGKSFFAQRDICNILPNIGLTEMAKRSVGTSTTTNVAHAIGTDNTTPALTDTLLGAEIFRKAIGTKTVVGQTERYGSVFTGSEIASPPKNIVEAGIFTVLTANTAIIIAHVTFTTFVLDVGKLFTIQSNISHKNGVAI